MGKSRDSRKHSKKRDRSARVIQRATRTWFGSSSSHDHTSKRVKQIEQIELELATLHGLSELLNDAMWCAAMMIQNRKGQLKELEEWSDAR